MVCHSAFSSDIGSRMKETEGAGQEERVGGTEEAGKTEEARGI
jgi:hypothetical protein